MSKWGTPAAVAAEFRNAGHKATIGPGSWVVVEFTKADGTRVKWRYTCKTGRWNRGRVWSPEFHNRGAEACLKSIAAEQLRPTMRRAAHG